ncbi:hypothetical protein BCR42DRAFT_413507 [Absidia repens]|uniref:Uncharacterized protein n=1 Tax=Absidia repens TaxID=90262 RepID=A0A1X2IHQ9_9FUNG|nr:hypothetical protein BCR42DRAFT_413507 [Absidia repens]
MTFTDITKKSILALLAGSTVYYMVQKSRKPSHPTGPPPTLEKQPHSETDTTPVPIPTAAQPGDMKSDDSLYS